MPLSLTLSLFQTAAAALSSYRSSFDTILSVSDVPSHHSPEFLSHIIEALKPGGSLLLQEPVAQRLITPEEAAVSIALLLGTLNKKTRSWFEFEFSRISSVLFRLAK